MTPLEIIEDKYPELVFYGIEVQSQHYHGHIEGRTIYINLLQPDWDWVDTAAHEVTHYEFDAGDTTNVRDTRVMRAEGFARRQAAIMVREVFGDGLMPGRPR